MRIGTLIEPLTGRRWSPAETRARVEARAAAFTARGLTSGERVIVLYGNSLEFFADLLALWRLNACAVTVDPRLTAFEIETLARAARPKLALAYGATDARITAALTALGVAIVDSEERSDAAAPAAKQHAHDPALILFTSGTTGAPKGVVHTHASLQARWTALRDALGTAAYARTLCLLPTHFGHGLICNALFPWLGGADLYVTPPFRADILARLGALIDEHAITALSSVPPVWTLALRLSKPPQKATLKRVHCGSAPLSAATWRQVQSWAGTRDVLNSYGITETGSWTAGTTPGTVEPEDGLIGQPWGAEFRITAPEPESPEIAPSPTGEAGMIWLKTPALMAGYFERDDLTAQVVRGGWLKTGDIGLVDGRGNLYLRGRERDEINKGGMKVYPGDVDGIALQCAGVTDACAFAVSDPLFGQDVGLAVALARGTALGQVKAFLATHLAKHQLPVQWHVVDEIPRTARGKVNRAQVAAACAANAKRRAEA
jgi:oxalate---CoA ligase